MFTHRHADGGFYSYVGPQSGKHPDTGEWVAGVCYRGADNALRWTDESRWEERFEELPPSRFVDEKKVEVSQDDEVVAAFIISVNEMPEAREFILRSANHALERMNDPVAKQFGRIMKAQAEMISMGLHLRDLDFPDLMGDVNSFHVKFDHAQENYGIPKMLAPDLHDFRHKFHNEETTEYHDEYPKLSDAMERKDHREIVNSLELQLDALADAVWVLLGTADIQFGRKVFYEAWKRVVKANMAKVRADKASDDATETGRDKKFDIVKPAGWTPPDHRDLVQDYLRSDGVTCVARED